MGITILNGTGIDGDAFQSALRAVLRDAKDTGDGVMREKFIRAVDARLGATLPGYGVMLDSLEVRDAASDQGFTGMGALRHVYQEVLTEERPPLTGLSLIPFDTSVPLGKRLHEIRRNYTRGEAVTWRGANTEMPNVGVSQVSRTFGTQFYVAQVLWDVFEEITDTSNPEALRINLQTVRAVLDEYLNHKTWWGDDAAGGVFGILNYPWLARISLVGPSDLAFSIEESLGSVDTDEFIRELVRLVTYPRTASKGAFAPNKIAWGQTVDTFLRSTLLKNTGSLTPISLLARFLGAQPHITNESQIAVCPELDDCFGAGASAILVLRQDRGSVANVVPGGGVQVLPIVEQGFKKFQPAFMQHGGIVWRRVGDGALGLVKTTPDA